MNSKLLNKQTTSQRLQFYKWLMFTILLAYFAFYWPTVMADNPLKDVKIVTGTDSNKDIGNIFSFFIKIVAVGMVCIGVLYAFSDLLFGMVRALKDAQQSKDWGSFFFTLLMLLIAAAMIIVIGSLSFQVLDKLGDYITKITA